jgi:hypothetical protein
MIVVNVHFDNPFIFFQYTTTCGISSLYFHTYMHPPTICSGEPGVLESWLADRG